MFEFPTFHYFRSKNPYTGSVGDFRFRLAPDGELLKAWAWPGPYCREAVEPEKIVTAEFPLTPEGLTEAENWLTQQAAQ